MQFVAGEIYVDGIRNVGNEEVVFGWRVDEVDNIRGFVANPFPEFSEIFFCCGFSSESPVWF
jgi:hypothetical protein